MGMFRVKRGQSPIGTVQQLTVVRRASEASTLQVPEGYIGRQYATDLSNHDYPRIVFPDEIAEGTRKTVGSILKQAMTSTKRKFDTLLNSLTADDGTYNSLASNGASKNNNNGTTTGGQQADDDSQSKRRRGLRPFSFASAGTSHFMAGARNSFALDESIANSALARRLDQFEPLRRSSPNFAPWDRPAFLERLKTFAPVTSWGIKPERINEVHWAKRGWSCVGRDRVRCRGGCEKEIYIQLFPDEDEKLITVLDEAGPDEAEWSQAKSESLPLLSLNE